MKIQNSYDSTVGKISPGKFAILPLPPPPGYDGNYLGLRLLCFLKKIKSIIKPIIPRDMINYNFDLFKKV